MRRVAKRASDVHRLIRCHKSKAPMVSMDTIPLRMSGMPLPILESPLSFHFASPPNIAPAGITLDGPAHGCGQSLIEWGAAPSFPCLVVDRAGGPGSQAALLRCEVDGLSLNSGSTHRCDMGQPALRYFCDLRITRNRRAPRHSVLAQWWADVDHPTG